MKKVVFCLVMACCCWCASGAEREFSGDRVRLLFDDETASASRIEVMNAEGVFVPMAGKVMPEILAVTPGAAPEELRVGRLLRTENADSRFVYALEGRPGWELICDFSGDSRLLRWALTVTSPDRECVGLEVNYRFADLYIGERTEFNNMSLTPNGYPELTYRADYIGEFPLTAILDKHLDAGLTINATFGVMRPLFSILYNKLQPERSLVWRNEYIGAGDGISASVSIDLFGHDGDWRPGLGKVFDFYRPYFSTDNAAIRAHEGNFLCAWYFLGFTDKQLSDMIEQWNLTNCEVMFYNPNYGVYAPDVADDESWTILMREHERFEDFAADPQRRTSYREINDTVARMRKHGVGSFIYFNYIDGSRTLPELMESFRDQIFINAENRMGRGKIGGESLGNDNMYIMQMEPGTPWADYCEEQARKLLARIPDCDGYFIDMTNGYGVYDANHSDGVTVIGGRKAYYDAIGIERMQRHLFTTLWQPSGKGIWANGPKFPEIARYCDALIAEIPGWTIPERDPGVPQIGLLCLDKPFVYMLAAWRADNDPPQIKDIERHFKYALLHGGFIDAFIPMQGEGRLEYFRAYRPLFDAIKGKRWVFDTRPLEIPAPLYGNIFTYDDGSYTVYVLDHDDSLAAGKWETHEAVDIAVRVAGLERIERVEFTGVDVPEQKIELPFSVENGELHVRIPRFAIAGMLRLIPKGGMSIGR